MLYLDLIASVNLKLYQNNSVLWFKWQSTMLPFKWRIRVVHCQHYTHWKKAISLLINCVSPFLADFPRLEQWTDNTSLSESSLFIDGFLYISSGPSKTTVDRRGRDGERKMPVCKKKKKKTPGKANQSINPFVSNSNCVFVRGLLQLSADRSIRVSLSAVKLPIV